MRLRSFPSPDRDVSLKVKERGDLMKRKDEVIQTECRR